MIQWLVLGGLPVLILFQIKVWDCNTGKCIETLKVRPVTLISKGAGGGAQEAGLRQDSHPQSPPCVLAGSPGCGPRLHLHPRWETPPGVWSCGLGKLPSPCMTNHPEPPMDHHHTRPSSLLPLPLPAQSRSIPQAQSNHNRAPGRSIMAPPQPPSPARLKELQTQSNSQIVLY